MISMMKLPFCKKYFRSLLKNLQPRKYAFLKGAIINEVRFMCVLKCSKMFCSLVNGWPAAVN